MATSIKQAFTYFADFADFLISPFSVVLYYRLFLCWLFGTKYQSCIYRTCQIATRSDPSKTHQTMSLLFTVSYNNVLKKITCSRASTVNQLVQQSIEKFRLPQSSQGTLLHNNKELDGLLPLRLTNLVNNAKLALKISNGNRDVTVKIVGTIKGELKQKIVKTQTISTIQALLEQFSQAVEVHIDYENSRVQLSVLDARVANSSHDFAALTVGSLIGLAANVVMRLDVELKANQAKREQLQRDQEALRKRIEERKKQMRLLEKEMKEDEARAAGIELSESPKTEVQAEVPGEEAQNEVPMDVDAPQEVPLGTSLKEIPQEVPQQETPQNLQKEELVSSLESTVESNLDDGQDIVFLPSGLSTRYDNPESDYNLTVSQAEKYYAMIKAMQTGRRKEPKQQKRAPQKYVIRMRFPDLALLQFHIEDLGMKLGQLLKKVDGYIESSHINHYRLKSGIPPFKEIAMGFAENNVALRDHNEFQDEKILLIWEPTEKHSQGPFLKSNVHTRSVLELPTMKLDQQRGQLAEEEHRPSSSGTNSERSGDEQKKKGLPKWFRPVK